MTDSAEKMRKADRTRIFFDTEFIEDGKTIDLISIGMVRDDGETYYAESSDCDLSRADQWVKDNVLIHLRGGSAIKSRRQIAADIIAFAGPSPEFWAYYADYDWVVLCQLYGRMIDLPNGWPMFCRDLKQLAGDTVLPQQISTEHHALADAKWAAEAFAALSASGTKSDGGGGAQFVEGYFTDQYAAGAKPPVGPSDPIPSQPDPAPIVGLEPVVWQLRYSDSNDPWVIAEKVNTTSLIEWRGLVPVEQAQAHAAEQVRPLVEALEGLIEAVELDADEGLEGIGSYTGARLTDAKNAIRARGQV